MDVRTYETLPFLLRFAARDPVLIQPQNLLYVLPRQPQLEVQLGLQQEDLALKTRHSLGYMVRNIVLGLVRSLARHWLRFVW